MIANSGHDENGKYTGGQAGDQTGTEWQIINWYSRPWTCVLRYNDKTVRAEIATLAKAAANNNKIGYDQGNRYSFWNQLKANNYDPAKITTACEADCSAGVAAIVKATGYRLGIAALKNVSIYAYTGNLKSILKSAGFTVLTASKYLTSDKYLLAGDILLYEGHHTAINVTDGSKSSSEAASDTDTTTYPCWVQSGDDWYYRTSAGVNAHGWQSIQNADGNRRWYYFDTSTGKMLKGWFTVEGLKYYAEESGDLAGALYRSDGSGAQSVWEI